MMQRPAARSNRQVCDAPRSLALHHIGDCLRDFALSGLRAETGRQLAELVRWSHSRKADGTREPVMRYHKGAHEKAAREGGQLRLLPLGSRGAALRPSAQFTDGGAPR
jgi:hypothetical protein